MSLKSETDHKIPEILPNNTVQCPECFYISQKQKKGQRQYLQQCIAMLHSRDFFMRLGQGARHITATDDRKDKDKKEDKDDNDNTGDNVNKCKCK